MSQHDFDARVKEIERRYAQHREGADAGRDQELARLFIEAKESGRGQEWLAQRMGRTQGWVQKQLVFGRFLAWIAINPTGINSFSPPKPLTERRFRDNWSKAGKQKKDTEADRFARVLELLKADTSDTPKNYGNLVKKPGLKKAIVELISDGKRRTSAEIAEAICEKVPDATAIQVGHSLKQIRDKPPPGMVFDERHAGRTHKYRLVARKNGSAAPVVPVDPEQAGTVAAEALPLVAECISILKQPEVKRATTLALDHLWKVERMLSRLLVPEEVV